MPRKVTPPPKGIWKLLTRVRRIALSEGLRGKGGGYFALGIGAWGLGRVRSMAKQDDEILLHEPLGPGQTMVIRHETVTRAEDDDRQTQVRKRGKELKGRAAKAEKQAKKARRRLSRAERAQHDAQLAKDKTKSRRRSAGRGTSRRRGRRRSR